MTNPLKAVSFDLWDTLVDDDSDEPKRREKGLRSKPEERRHLLWESLNRHQEAPLDEVSAAFDAADDAFNQAWKEGAVTWKVSERIEVALARLGRELPAEEKETLAAALGRMEVDIPPDPVAQHLLGAMITEGWAGDFDAVEAYKWFTLAIRQRQRVIAHDPELDPLAARERLRPEMNQNQIKRGEEGARDWRPQR